jgi:hypothetical protein
VSVPLAPPVIINEVFYDAAGADGGFEFVELVNRGDSPLSLAGYRLEAGDGAAADRWRALWTGAAADVIPPHRRFVLGEGRVAPAPDRVVPLGLENGPDAVRLTAPDGAKDVLGYGALTYTTYFEGRPAEDVPGGYSLARLPDGADTDDNRADFAATTPPTPGAPNQPETDLALQSAHVDEERVEPGDAVTFRAMVANRGIGTLREERFEVQLWAARWSAGDPHEQGGELSPDSLVARYLSLDELEPGDSVAVALTFTPPEPGAWDITLAARVEEDGAPANDRSRAQIQVGPGALLISEVAAAPDDGPEWVELLNVSPLSVVIDGWSLEDATGRRAKVDGLVPGGAFAIEPDSFVVLTSDPLALLERHPELPRHKTAVCAPWPALNNSAASGEPFADRVIVRTPDERVSDAMAYPGGDPKGTTRERRAAQAKSREDATWGASAVTGGTPGRANSLAGGPPVPGVALVASPSALRPGAGERLLLTYRTGFERARITLALFDLRGRAVRRLLDGTDGPGRGGVAWDGADPAGHRVPAGVYVAALEARDAAATSSGNAVARARTPVVVR